MKNNKLTDEQLQEKMKEIMREGTYNKSKNFLGEENMKKFGLTKENLTIKNILAVATKLEEEKLKNK